MRRRIKLTIAYDGTSYYGWQIQKKEPTIQGVLEKVLSEILDEEINIVGSGRTDTGVHAIGQVAHFDTSNNMDVETMKKAFNSRLPRSIVIRDVEEVDPSFHARFSAKSRIYRYFISHINLPFMTRYSWYIGKGLDLSLMKKLEEIFVGEYNFGAFGSPTSEEGSTVRRVFSFKVKKKKFYTMIEVEANAFLRKMVRNMVGSAVSLALGKLTIDNILEMLEKGKKIHHYKPAPPEGLFLWKVVY
ncbi:MAG: tRNA pseudouridine(38-40) synthase TruA [Thermosulfidibacteraceae bacterium]|jgi:tRNA pseudouridine38-40 synthase